MTAVAAKFSLILGMLGNVLVTTLKAFPEQAYREIINSLGQRYREDSVP
jgi:uncharacterized protein with GYD domain